MNRHGVATAIFLLGAWMMSGSAASADESEFTRSGFYLGGGFGAAIDFADDAVRMEELYIDIDPTWAVNVRAGYRMLPWLGFEVMYEGMFNFPYELDDVRVAELTANDILANVKFVAPWERFQPYVLFGLGAQYSEFDVVDDPYSKDRWNLLIRPAFGLDAYIAPNWVAFAELGVSIAAKDWNDIGGALTDTLALTPSVGIQYRF